MTNTTAPLAAVTTFTAVVVSVFALSHVGDSHRMDVPPGARNPDVTQRTIYSTICRPGGYTRSVRPSVSWSSDFKRKLAARRHVDPRDFQLDHAISLEVGGAPKSPRNLWLEPWAEAHRDDHGIEASLHRQVCAGEITLREAQRQEISYKRANG